MKIELRIWGELACFTSLGTQVERVSYAVMTPSAARGVLEAVFWKPEIRYEIDSVAVLRPIEFISLRRNEIQDTVSVSGGQGVRAWMQDPSGFRPYMVDSAGRNDVQGEHRTQRNSTVLRDVAYHICGRMLVKQPNNEDHIRKYGEMFNRRSEKGQCFRQPCLGIREYAAFFSPATGQEKPIAETRDLGIMFYDWEFPETQPDSRGTRPASAALVAPAKLENGVLDVAAMRENLFREVTP